MKGPQRGHAQVQLLVVARVGDVPGAGQIELGLGDAGRLRIDDTSPAGPARPAGPRGRLPSASRHSPRRKRASMSKRLSRMVLDELLVKRGRLGQACRVLLALADQQLDLDPLLRLRARLQRLLVELQGLGVVGLLVFLGRLEVVVGEFQVDVGDLLLAVGREQVFGLGPDRSARRAEVALAGQGHGLGEACPACPRM